MLKRSVTRAYRIFSRNSATYAERKTGLNYEFDKEDRNLRHEIHAFTKEVVIPLAPFYDQTSQFPLRVIEAAHEAGILNASIPREYGGKNFDLMEKVLISEEIAYGCAAMASAIAINDFAETPLIIAGSEALKRKFLGRMTEEPLVAAYAVTEADAGSDVAGIQMKCEKKGNEYVLNGTKTWVNNAGPASWFYVLCRSDPDPQTPISKAFTAFVVDGDTHGVSKGSKELTMGVRACDIRTVNFEEVRVPEENVVGKPGDGFVITMKMFDKTRAEVAAIATGLISRCVDEAGKYALERKTFGVPIADHQAVKAMLADMAIDLELARLITYRSAWEWMTGRPRGYFSSIAKCFCADVANTVAANSVQIFGGNGFNQSYPMEKLLRDSKALQIFEGTSQIQRTIIARDLLRRFKDTTTFVIDT
ncbi:unnamed protein product [Anisakis simplex]|uniref:Medium-chain specific acyl-CoA dehydrogenase, mitochondrial n=1 Tax=Anisakis simplex TaxID=6269 RepID=A0A0M3JZE7_ANISI|nr:unnamed protein product [Anisakis simplex]